VTRSQEEEREVSIIRRPTFQLFASHKDFAGDIRLDANEEDVCRIRDVRTDLLQHARIPLYSGRD
jgi:hypothetical protein